MASRIEELQASSVSEATLTPDGNLTRPRSWGVYELGADHGSTRRYRIGNHRVRLDELQREFGNVRTVAIFTQRPHARAYADALNAA